MLLTFHFSTFLLMVFLITSTVWQRGSKRKRSKHCIPGLARLTTGRWKVATGDNKKLACLQSSVPPRLRVAMLTSVVQRGPAIPKWRGCRLGRIVCLCAVSLSIQRIIHQSSACTQLQTFSMSQLLIACRGTTPERPKCKAKASPSLLLGDGLQHPL